MWRGSRCSWRLSDKYGGRYLWIGDGLLFVWSIGRLRFSYLRWGGRFLLGHCCLEDGVEKNLSRLSHCFGSIELDGGGVAEMV